MFYYSLIPKLSVQINRFGHKIFEKFFELKKRLKSLLFRNHKLYRRHKEAERSNEPEDSVME